MLRLVRCSSWTNARRVPAAAVHPRVTVYGPDAMEVRARIPRGGCPIRVMILTTRQPNQVRLLTG